jgi:hypothetical protein
MAGLNIFISEIAEYIDVEVALRLSAVHHVTNYETPTANKRENLRSPVISK